MILNTFCNIDFFFRTGLQEPIVLNYILQRFSTWLTDFRQSGNVYKIPPPPQGAGINPWTVASAEQHLTTTANNPTGLMMLFLPRIESTSTKSQ